MATRVDPQVSAGFGIEKPFLVNAPIGSRVQISPSFDLWVRGARYGTIKGAELDKHGREIVIVRMDHPQVRKLQRFFPVDLTLTR